jgi:hypothetical protein
MKFIQIKKRDVLQDFNNSFFQGLNKINKRNSTKYRVKSMGLCQFMNEIQQTFIFRNVYMQFLVEFKGDTS